MYRKYTKKNCYIKIYSYFLLKQIPSFIHINFKLKFSNRLMKIYYPKLFKAFTEIAAKNLKINEQKLITIIDNCLKFTTKPF